MSSHLDLPLCVTRCIPPSKESAPRWWSLGAWSAYLDASAGDPQAACIALRDEEVAVKESTLGIGIDPLTGAQDAEHLYAAHYLRLREGWRLGLLAAMSEKRADGPGRRDLLPELIRTEPSLLVGGQRRVCTATLTTLSCNTKLPLPVGRSSGFPTATVEGVRAWLVKWTLFSPAIWPELAPQPDAPSPIPHHPGGWLPNWVDPVSHEVRLRKPASPRDPESESRADYRAREAGQPFIDARLVAALVPKAIAVTGWGLGTPDTNGSESNDRSAGPHPVQLAVPAGAVYYFACHSETAANDLAAALNWHGTSAGTAIRNRRSTLFGEKGFGLGACSGFVLHPTPPSA